MPFPTLTPEQSAALLRKKGYDPTQFLIDREGNIRRRQAQGLFPGYGPPPAPVGIPTAKAPTGPSQLESLGRGAAQAALPSAAGLLTGAGVGTAIGGPVGGIAGIIAAILAGGATALY
jgi:hypothetical protein